MIDLDFWDTTYQEIFTKSLLNKMLHRVGMIWMIEKHEELKYDLDIQNSDWLTGGPWYNTSICKKLHGKMFERFIINAKTERYNIMCSIDVYEKEHQ